MWINDLMWIHGSISIFFLYTGVATTFAAKEVHSNVFSGLSKCDCQLYLLCLLFSQQTSP